MTKTEQKLLVIGSAILVTVFFWIPKLVHDMRIFVEFINERGWF